MEAEDVVASYQHHMGEDSKSAAKTILDPVKEIKTPDKHTVVFVLEAGNADFPYIMSDYHIGIMPSKDGKVINATSGVGTAGSDAKVAWLRRSSACGHSRTPSADVRPRSTASSTPSTRPLKSIPSSSPGL